MLPVRLPLRKRKTICHQRKDIIIMFTITKKPFHVGTLIKKYYIDDYSFLLIDWFYINLSKIKIQKSLLTFFYLKFTPCLHHFLLNGFLF